ncbi:MAG TPA: helicase-related protein [Myxococcales bacterium]|nr:helicase-related protein [Myxococcales bacterium]
MPRFLKGMKIVHRAQRGWGVGHVLAVSEDPPRLSAHFPGRPGGPVMLSSRDAQLWRFRFAPDSPALLADGSAARVLRALPGRADDLYRYTVEVPGNKPQVRSEADLRAPAPREGPAEQLASGRWGTPEDFHLRSETVRLDLERRADALGALFASRVYVKPHQVSVAHQVLSAPQPRFVLADEVGLGKTIEAGLVLSSLLHAGLVKRCLVVAPSHLTVQWLAELFHKFNLLFTLMDPDRAKEDREAAEAEAPDDDASTWGRHPLVITSLEWLSRTREEAKAAADAGWDLVAIDEAHHLRGARAYEVAQALARKTWGLLLLTATPLQLDPAEYHALLRLVDPAPAATEQELRARLARQGELSAEVRSLLAGDHSAAERIARLFPDDPMLGDLRADALLAHLAESYGLSARLLRNRRAVVGGFTPRMLTKIPVELSGEERDLEREVRRALAQARLPSGAVLASLLRRMGSSPPALASGLSAAGEKKLAQRALAISRDSKLEAFHEFLRELGPSEKVLVFAEPRETIEYLRAALARRRIEALAYVGDLSPAERDKMVARFRDPDGPRVLLCTELGGEGRNFQHCHVLVNYDLAWSPAAIEQRIGRIDRIGQSREVRIHAFRPEGTLAARVLDVLDAGVGVFTEPVGGLDPVLEGIEAELLALASSDDAERWEKMTRALAERVSAARAQVARAYDPLLDLRSCDLAALRSLAERGARRIGARLLPSSDAEGALRAVATTLEMRLEAVTIEAAKRVGLAVDVDVDVMPGQVSFSVGPELKVDALAGFDLSQDRTVIGSFRREFAVQHEEHDSFATGHPLVEALFAWVRDGELGRAMVARAHLRGLSGAALDARFLITLPEPADLAQGARVPSRRAARHLEEPLLRVAVRLDGRGGVRVEDALTAQLDSAKLSAVPAPEGGPPGAFAQAIETGLRVAQEEAQRRLRRIVEAAKSGIAAEQEAAMRRLARWLAQSKVGVSDARRLLEAEAKIHEDAAAALDGARLELDQAALVQLA